MKLEWLLDFQALVEHGSFSRAADARAVTQPAFSRRIRSLEHWLGVTLVDRDHYPMCLTAAGNAYIDQAQQLLNHIYASRDQVRDLENAQTHMVIHAQHALAVAFFPSWLERLDILNDSCLVNIESGDLHDCIEAFLCGSGDFLLSYASQDIFSQLNRVDVESVTIGHDQLVPVVGLDEAGSMLQTINEHQPIQFLSHPDESFFGRLVQRQCLSALSDDWVLQKVCQNALSEALKALVLRGHGMAWLPRSLVEQDILDRRLAILPEPMKSLALEICLYRLNVPKSDAAATLWERVQER